MDDNAPVFEPRFMVLAGEAAPEDEWLTVPNAGYAAPHDVVLNTRTGETMVVRAVGGRDLLVIRGVGSRALPMRDEDELLILGRRGESEC